VLQQPIHSSINLTTALIDAVSIFPVGYFLGYYSVKMADILFILGGKYDILV
jgi:hypothetical protein